MSRFPERLSKLRIVVFLFALVAISAVAKDAEKPVGYYGYGNAASDEQIAAWDIDVRPDGKGLPPGSGSVEEGEFLYEDQCAQCHGSFGEGEGRYPSLAGGEGSLQEARPHKSVGSYWKYTSTLWDYIHRAMPFTRPESLSDDEVYAVTAYVLYLNDLVEDDFILSQQNLASMRLPNEDSFIADQRPDVHNERCISDCRDPAAIVIKSEAPLYKPDKVVVTQAVAAEPGVTVYQGSCGLCHDAGIGGAPSVGDVAQWSPRIEQGINVLYQHAISGFEGDTGFMPAKGGFVQLSDEEVKAAVDHMIERSQ